MAKVICKLDNASSLINGVRFVADRGQMISEDVSDDVAAAFAVIPGYTVAKAKPAEPDPAAAKAAADAAAKAAADAAAAAKATAKP